MAYEGITRAQEEMITLLIEGENITDVAKKLKVTRNTVYSWMSKDNVKAELGRRKRELGRQGNNYIMKDLFTYIDNIKELANDSSDKRVCLAANQYLINRIYGNPTTVLDNNTESNDNGNVDTNVLEAEIDKFKLKRVK
ncbi:helix-turn-helix domain-containing protein [Clostridium botulinum]|nr:helix-turn-helix domain-containing protein [Clostridium botulinum]NFL02406.1 helix-turn-helix domain-containing protein [Clostridium botulinum]